MPRYYVGVDPVDLRDQELLTVGVGVDVIDETAIRQALCERLAIVLRERRALRGTSLSVLGSHEYALMHAVNKARLDTLVSVARALRAARKVEVGMREPIRIQETGPGDLRVASMKGARYAFGSAEVPFSEY